MLSASLLYLIAFVLFFVLVFKHIKKGFGTLLDNHAENVKNRIQEAKDLRQQAQEALARYEAQQRTGNEEAKEIIQRAKTEAEILKQQALETIANDNEKSKQQLKHKISLIEANATEQYRQMVIAQSILATEQLLMRYQPEQYNAVKQVEKALKNF